VTGDLMRTSTSFGELQPRPLFERAIVKRALWASVKKLEPTHQMKNPVMFTVWIGSALTTVLYVQALFGKGEAPAGFILAIALWLWFTLLFANFAEAMAEGRGKAQADSLRKAKRDVTAKLLKGGKYGGPFELVGAQGLRIGDVVLVEAGDTIPGDGDVIEGVASVNESAITGESAPVIRESGGDRSAVTGGTMVLSDWLVMRIASNPGETFLDRMIAMVEGAKRQKTPNEIALDILLAALTIIFLLATATLLPPSAGCFPPSASPAWTAWSRPTSSPLRDGPWRPRATWTCCCWTRPAPSPWATARRWPSSPPRAWTSTTWPTPHSSPAWPTRPRKGAASWCWPRSSTACASGRSRPWARSSSRSRPRPA
jgi:hypothetical protein